MSFGFETLTCGSCGRSWSRQVTRGRKPLVCDLCRFYGVKVVRRPAAPAALELVNIGGYAVGERNDCTVRALATACGVDYSEAHEFMRKNGRRKGRGAYFHSVIARNQGAVLGRTLTYVNANSAKGLRTFLLRNPQMRYGTWILHMTRHVATLKDGKLVDSFDSSRKVIDGAWRVM